MSAPRQRRHGEGHPLRWSTPTPYDLRSIARELGGDVVGAEILCPGPGHTPRDRSLSVKLSPDGLLVHSFAGDDWRDCADHARRLLGLERVPRRAAEGRRQASKPEPMDDVRRERILSYIASVVEEILPVSGTPGEDYLRETRHIDTAALDEDVLSHTHAIGWHPAVRFRGHGHELDGQHLGCLVAVMTDPVTAKPTGGISRTYIHNGRKVGKAKGLCPAGVVRLSRDDDVLGGLFVAEGLETALAGMSIGLRPMWSTGSTAIMAKLPVVAGIEHISVIADHDANGAGYRAAVELESRWKAAGREARVWIPKSRGDLNDLLMGGAQ